MTLRVRASGLQKTATRVRVRQNPGVKLAAQIRVRQGGVMRAIFSTNGSAAAAPTNVRGIGRSNSTITVVTALTTAKSGASYAWTKLSGDSYWSATSPTGAQTAFAHTNTAPDMTYTAVFQVTITYSGGGTATANVNATAISVSGL